MKILVVGRGWTGNKVYSELKSRKHDVKLDSHFNVFETLSDTTIPKYDWIVNCAGITGFPNVDACENIKYDTMKANAIFPICLQRYAELNGSRFAQFSSGCIYQGFITDIMAEPNFFGSTYSISKGLSDSFLKHISVVFRIRMPFTDIHEPKNFLSKILKYTVTTKLYDGGSNSLSNHNEAISLACDLIEQNVENGPYNLVNSGTINMHEIADMLKINPRWFTAEEFKAVTAAGRSNCTIPPHPKMRPVHEALQEAISKLK
jgi:dTDP-4-dehydrorhamnose reductase